MSSSSSLNANDKAWMHGLAGALGGSTAMMMFYPLDFLRTRMHTLHQGCRTRQLRSANEIFQQEGLKGMYRGLAVSVVSHSIGWGMYLLTFRKARHELDHALGPVGAESSRGWQLGHAPRDFASACVAATITGTVITPIHVIKTRRQLHDCASKRESVRQIVAQQGWRAMFRGMGPQILLTGNTTIQVTIYEYLRRRCFRDKEDPSPLQVALASGVSKAIACALFNPLEVVRTRLQDKRNLGRPEYGSMSAGLHTIWRTEGIQGLYRALPVNIMRVVPSAMMAFVLYEKCLWGIRQTYRMTHTPHSAEHIDAAAGDVSPAL
ncbi:solute carrier family 25 (mitochondrial folate transporter), member 32 [Strigomonas culicis]|uniref:Solute carrier family 25 (Mitochondrial folate transporter), member 32 n=1 Tax=Strigomonas culicis TaxID=28005 RepID=S9U7R8_9TRYP|nr:solute carrier family 25 (mitochondrial folate transporter), member 32 [Strigomonas culicis]|eukprot:EPY24864.1 solute carrier family 25 (mitochondrial folate transporter), member 32 [Strigomonas culicis]